MKKMIKKDVVTWTCWHLLFDFTFCDILLYKDVNIYIKISLYMFKPTAVLQNWQTYSTVIFYSDLLSKYAR